MFGGAPRIVVVVYDIVGVAAAAPAVQTARAPGDTRQLLLSNQDQRSKDFKNKKGAGNVLSVGHLLIHSQYKYVCITSRLHHMRFPY